MSDISLSCSCGSFKAVLHDCGPSEGTRLKCYCKDCQAAAYSLGVEDTLDAHGGTELFHTIPSKLEITEGEEHLACMRLSPKGLLRWYASCCDTPVFNTLPSPSLRFVGVLTNTAENPDDFGPLTTIANTKDAKPGPQAPVDRNYFAAVFGVLSRHLGAVLLGKGKNPLFTDARIPVVTPRVLTKVQRKTATPDYSR